MTIQKIDQFISRLESGLTEDDRKQGWTENSRQALLKTFRKIRKEVRQGKYPAVNLARGLDSWGITSGELVELAAEISNELNAQPPKHF